MLTELIHDLFVCVDTRTSVPASFCSTTDHTHTELLGMTPRVKHQCARLAACLRIKGSGVNAQLSHARSTIQPGTLGENVEQKAWSTRRVARVSGPQAAPTCGGRLGQDLVRLQILYLATEGIVASSGRLRQVPKSSLAGGLSLQQCRSRETLDLRKAVYCVKSSPTVCLLTVLNLVGPGIRLQQDVPSVREARPVMRPSIRSPRAQSSCFKISTHCIAGIRWTSDLWAIYCTCWCGEAMRR